MSLSTTLFRVFLKLGLLGGRVYVAGLDSADRVDGVALWFEPGREIMDTFVPILTRIGSEVAYRDADREDQRELWRESLKKYLNADARAFWEKSVSTVVFSGHIVRQVLTLPCSMMRRATLFTIGSAAAKRVKKCGICSSLASVNRLRGMASRVLLSLIWMKL